MVDITVLATGGSLNKMFYSSCVSIFNRLDDFLFLFRVKLSTIPILSYRYIINVFFFFLRVSDTKLVFVMNSIGIDPNRSVASVMMIHNFLDQWSICIDFGANDVTYKFRSAKRRRKVNLLIN